MAEFQIVSLILLALVAMDAAGDAFRIHKWQVIHHVMEVLGIVTFFVLWKFFDFRWEYVAMYITGRIWLFDPLMNLIAGYRLTYAGKSSLYGRVLSWFMGKVKEPGMLVWWIRALVLVAWVAWFVVMKIR